jgi:hypothetical protein
MHEVLSGPDGIVTSVRVIGDKIVASCTDRSVWSWEIVEKHKYEEAPSQVAVVIAREPPSKTLYIDLERNGVSWCCRCFFRELNSICLMNHL